MRLFEDNLRVVIPARTSHFTRLTETESCLGGDAKPVGRREAVEAFLRIRQFMSESQKSGVADCMNGEEAQFFFDKMQELAQLVDSMPVTYQQQDEKDPMAYLHYFYGGSDWYITEKDKDGEVEQAFGYACLNGDLMCAEYGYISITELVSVETQLGRGVDLDFHFKPTRMSEVKRLLEAKNGY